MPDRLSQQCQDFINKLIMVDVQERLTAQQALNHVWIRDLGGTESISAPAMNAEIVENLRKYKGESILKRAAMNILVKSLDIKEIQSLKKEF